MFLLLCILGTTFMPLYADNELKAINNTNEATFSEDNSSLAPRKRPKSKKKGGKKGGRRGGGSDISFEKGKIEIDAGAGVPIFAIIPGVTTKVLPVSLGAEYCFWSGEKSSWGVGVGGAYQALSFLAPDINMDMGGFGNFKADPAKPEPMTFSSFYAGAKITWHYNFNSNIEFYWNLGIGYFGMSFDGKQPDNEEEAFSFNYNGPLPTQMMGFKFFFTDNIGAFVEFGFDGAKAVGAGIALKF